MTTTGINTIQVPRKKPKQAANAAVALAKLQGHIGSRGILRMVNDCVMTPNFA
jgi:hypothetical protein